MKLVSVSRIHVCELVFVSEMYVFSTCFNFQTIILLARWIAVGISYKHYCHLLKKLKSFVGWT